MIHKKSRKLIKESLLSLGALALFSVPASCAGKNRISAAIYFAGDSWDRGKRDEADN